RLIDPAEHRQERLDLTCGPTLEVNPVAVAHDRALADPVHDLADLLELRPDVVGREIADALVVPQGDLEPTTFNLPHPHGQPRPLVDRGVLVDGEHLPGRETS